MRTVRSLPEVAERIADRVLFPAATTVDRADRVPASHLDALAEAGLYGLAAPGACPDADPLAVVEALASGCLSTAFVWLQHHGPVRAVAASAEPGLRERWLDPLATGTRRAGIALAGIRPGTARVGVERIPGGYRIDGTVPWVTGWNMIDTLYLAGCDAGDAIHYLLVDAVAGPTLEVTPHDLVAVRASGTVAVRFTGHTVGADRLVAVQPYTEWARSDASGSRLNGALALGVARRCALLTGDEALAAGLERCRTALLAADAETLPAARAAASELAFRAAALASVYAGSRAVLADNHAQRLVREATFLLVFGSRPAIREDLLARLRDGVA